MVLNFWPSREWYDYKIWHCVLFARVYHGFRVLCTWACFWSHIVVCGTWGALSCAVDMQCIVHMQHTTVSYHSFILGFVVQTLYFTTAAGNAVGQDLDVWHPGLGLQWLPLLNVFFLLCSGFVLTLCHITAAGNAARQDLDVCHPRLALQWLSLLISHVFLCF